MQVDLAPTMLGLAGIATPESMDGKSLVGLVVTRPQEAPPSIRLHLAQLTATSDIGESGHDTVGVAPPVPRREASFVEYYNQGPWEVGKRHALDDWSNTYIGLYVRSTTKGHLKYGEYDPYGKQSEFKSVYFYELFDLDKDPFELHNIFNSSSAELKAWLHTTVRAYYECAGASCM